MSEVADRAGATDRTVRRWCESGKLAATAPLTGWTVMSEDLSAFVGRRDWPVPADGHSTNGHRPAGREGPPDLSDLGDLVRELPAAGDRHELRGRDVAGAGGVLQERVAVLEAQLLASP